MHVANAHENADDAPQNDQLVQSVLKRSDKQIFLIF